MRKVAALVLALALLMMLGAVVPVLAIGPTKAAQVGHNPNVFINPSNQKTALNTPRGDKSALDRITWLGNTVFLYMNVSNVKGIMNNAIIADKDTVDAMNANPENFDNKWIYLSGENNGNQHDGHGMFYWWITSPQVGFPEADAVASILARNPEGGFVKTNYAGP